MDAPSVVIVRPPDDATRRLWSLILSLAEKFGAEREWTLVGGLMVQLHGFEHDDDPRPTADVDVLGAAKRPPKMTEAMAAVLIELGAEVAEPPRSDPKLGYRFEFEGEIVELLGPDGLRSDPKTTGGLKTFQVPGGSQALRRTEIVLVSLDGSDPVAVRRPDLLGAILIKARVVAKRREEKFASDREDLIRLLGYVEDPRRMADEMAKSEEAWLRGVSGELDFDDPALSGLFPARTLEQARQAFALLTDGD
jgi:hypothetical protein